MEKSLDVLDHDRSNHRGRQEGNKKIAHEHDFAALPGQRSPYQLPKSRPEYPHNGQYGAELNDDLEHLVIAGRKVAPIAYKEQMGRTGYGDEFGKTFDQAQKQGFDHKQNVIGHIFPLSLDRKGVV